MIWPTGEHGRGVFRAVGQPPAATACNPYLVLGDFVTERIALRSLSSEDLDRLADLNRDAEIIRFITGRPSSIDETHSVRAIAVRSQSTSV